ncbi:unnamed protein product [Rotaria sordida]|uniref:Uncharacterized protein n=1 Tax=Rotaria sordida TaxID=392033 RepID=A0A814RMQ1_9BILA|nr:unnamed protein product [Rotaria sordida]CAF1360479.1 unnamed protein product [Rotaria sordida]
MFLYEDLSLPFKKKMTVTGICSIVFGLLLIGFELGQVFNGYDYSTIGTFINGIYSIYGGILFLVLCRQQIYALKSLLALIIIQLLILLSILILSCLVITSSHSPQCIPTDDYCEQYLLKKYRSKILAMLAITIYLLLLASTIFSLFITIQEWRARKLAANNISNRYLLINIPLPLRGNLQKTGIAYIVLGLLIAGLDVGLLLNGYLFSYYTGFISGFFSIVYGVVLIILSVLDFETLKFSNMN